jgi:hypothetical protein
MLEFVQIVSSPIGAFLVLALAAYLEVQCDACFQSGLYHSSGVGQIGWFIAGTVVLVCYSLFLELCQARFRQAYGYLCGSLLCRGAGQGDSWKQLCPLILEPASKYPVDGVEQLPRDSNQRL